MKPLEEMMALLRDLEKRIETLEARERLLTWGLATEDFGLVDAGSAGATQQDWVECTVGGNTGYIRIYASE
jgi:hypothetical protein